MSERDSQNNTYIRHLIEPFVTKTLEQDTGSVFSTNEAWTAVNQKIRSALPRKKETLRQHYEAGDISRRKFLRMMGFGLGGAMIASSGIGYFLGQKVFDERQNPTGYVTIDGMSFDNVVNASDIGLDNTGGSDVSGALSGQLKDNTVIEFPPGEYLFNGTVQNTSLNNVALVGKGEKKTDVRFQVPDGTGKRIMVLGGTFLQKNFVFDQGENFNRNVEQAIKAPSGSTIKLVNTGFVGTEPSDNEVNGKTGGTYMSITGGSVLVDGFTWALPVHYDCYNGNSVLFWTGRKHHGDLTFRNMYIENGSGSVIYSGKDYTGNKSNPSGDVVVTVENCFFKNALDKAVRLSGKNDVVKNCTFVLDPDSWHPQNSFVTFDCNDGSNGRNATGIWVQSADVAKTGPTIEDCDFIWKKIPQKYGSRGPIYVNSGTGGATIRNCRFTNETGTPAITAANPSGNTGKPIAMTIEACHFTGNGSGAAVKVSGRSGSTMKDCCINMPNGGSISGVQTTNISRGGNCEEADPTSPVGTPTGVMSSTGSSTESGSGKQQC